MLLIDLYRTIIINLIFTEHISTRLGHPMTDTFYIFLSPPSNVQNIFPRFFSPPCRLGSWFQMRFCVSIFLILCRNFGHLALSLEYQVHDMCCKMSKLICSPHCLATLFLHLFLLVMEIANFLSHLQSMFDFWSGGTEG